MKRIDGSYIFFLFFHFIRDFTLSIFNFSRCDPSPRSRFFLFLFFFFPFCRKKRNKLKTIRWRLPVNITVSFDRGLNLVSITLERARFLAREKNLIRRKEIFNQDISFFPLFLNYSYYSSALLMIIT